jgi:RNA polymerase sigma-70 factor (ECF subfamily)
MIGVGSFEAILKHADVDAEIDVARARDFAAFVVSHRDRAVGLAWRLVGGDAAAAEDVAQEAFLKAHRGLSKFREDAKLSTWFYRILVNEAQRHLRWRWVRQRVAGEMPEDPLDPRPEPTGDPVLRDRIARAVAALPRGQREAFVLVHLEGFTIKEAAAITNRAMGTIKSHLHRATGKLRVALADLDPQAGVTQ